jgi:hypothetical protein
LTLFATRIEFTPMFAAVRRLVYKAADSGQAGLPLEKAEGEDLRSYL